MTTVRYIACCGVCIESQGLRILADPFSCIEGGMYPLTPAEDLAAMVAGRFPYEGIDLLYISHWHLDHFHPGHAAALLGNNPGAALLAPEDVVAKVRAALPGSLARERVLLADDRPGRGRRFLFRGRSLHTVGTVHMGKQLMDTPHVSLLIGGEQPIFIAGDAMPSRDNLQPFADLGGAELSIAPFNYLTLPSARRVVDACLGAEEQIAVHLPNGADEDERHLIRQTEQAVERLREAGRVAVAFMENGQIYQAFTKEVQT